MYSYPLSDFTAQALKNILFSLYSKGLLLSKAVNGQFFVPQELCDRVYNYTNPEWIVNAMKNTPDLVGIEINVQAREHCEYNVPLKILCPNSFLMCEHNDLCA